MPEHVVGTQLTVAIPTCNGSRHIAEALRSVLTQHDASFDLIVVDDRSDDGTLSVVRALAGDGARIESNSERLGLAGNWNRCVELAKTPWVAVFHQDDVMLPGHLCEHLRAISEMPGSGAGLIISAVRFVDDNGYPAPSAVSGMPPVDPEDRFAPYEGGYRKAARANAGIGFAPGEFVRELAIGNPVRCSAVTTKREAHASVGGFDTAYKYAVDWDFWAQVSKRWGVLWLTKPSVAVRWHSASETHHFHDSTLDLDEVAAVIYAIHTWGPATGPDAAMLRGKANRRLARSYLNRAFDAAKANNKPLMLSCLREASRLDRGTWLRILANPRLALRLLRAGVITPGRKGSGSA